MLEALFAPRYAGVSPAALARESGPVVSEATSIRRSHCARAPCAETAKQSLEPAQRIHTNCLRVNGITVRAHETSVRWSGPGGPGATLARSAAMRDSHYRAGHRGDSQISHFHITTVRTSQFCVAGELSLGHRAARHCALDAVYHHLRLYNARFRLLASTPSSRHLRHQPARQHKRSPAVPLEVMRPTGGRAVTTEARAACLACRASSASRGKPESETGAEVRPPR